MNAGELRRRLARLPADTPVRIARPDGFPESRGVGRVVVVHGVAYLVDAREVYAMLPAEVLPSS